jgi:hypothetical protein
VEDLDAPAVIRPCYETLSEWQFGYGKAELARQWPEPRKQQQEMPMNGSVIREPSRTLKEQFSRSSQAWKEQSDPVFRFWARGDWWGFPFFSLSARRYFGENETLCLY